MEFSDWVSQYSVHHPLMDTYHHLFFQGMEHIERMANDCDMEPCRERMAFLLSYASMHFDAEESVLEQAGYPGLEEHRSRHAVFRQRLNELQQRSREDSSAATTMEVAQLARQWWMEHILHEDMKYAPFLEANSHRA